MWYDPYKVTNIWMLLGTAFGFGVFESLWRRWFGGGLKFSWLKPFDRRFIKHCVNILALFSVCCWIRGMIWYWALTTSLIIQICFWTLTFGMYFDIGRGGKPVTDEDIKDYNKPWFAPILNWCFKPESLYTPFYDFCAMMIRFTWPVVLVAFIPTFNSGIALLGQWTAFVYAIGWVLYEKGSLKHLGPTEFGEFAAGAGVGVGVVLVGML